MHVLPDLIFMDINMPLMNGFECLTQLKRKIRFTNIPVVILTTSNNRSQKELAKELGANFFLSKLSDFSLFIRNITDMLNLNFSPIMKNV
jgi:CheY-like chemotaxis protein